MLIFCEPELFVMKKTMYFFFLVSLLLLLAGCGLPDMPGPIGIPGV